MVFPLTATSVFQARRKALGKAHPSPAVFVAGSPPARNYPANHYSFRPNSHYAYFGGPRIFGAAVLIEGEKSTLFAPPPDRDDALWHGPTPSLEEMKAAGGFDAAAPLSTLSAHLTKLGKGLATLPPQDAGSIEELGKTLGRGFSPLNETDGALADSVISIRLSHDRGALDQLRSAAQVSSQAHIAGMRATRPGKSEYEICSAITGVMYAAGMSDAYGPIVSVKGEILHNDRHDGVLAEGDLLLCDVGGETPEGWASDITRTWPVNGRFSPTQKAIYEAVLESQLASIAKVRAGNRYRDVHETAKRKLVEGLVTLGIFRGEVDGLLERGAAALFFPHGIGHLLGLDVHDMEDLGDRAGYAPGRTRSSAFGDRYLRLDRDLSPGMAVTIEPGFYQVPGILEDETLTGPLGKDLDRATLARFADVRGIRIEDDVLCTSGDPEVMTASCPKSVAEIEELVGRAG